MTHGVDVDLTRFLSQPRTPDAARANRAQGDNDQLREVTREFESLFIKQMLDSMYDTLNPEDGLFYGGQAENIFRDMLNMEYARDMAHSGSFGLADAMYDQLSSRQSAAAYEDMGHHLE